MKRSFTLLELAALLACCLAVLLSVRTAADAQAELRGAVLRLHVIAHSDAPRDQAVKLLVRDALLGDSEALAAVQSKQQATQTAEALTAQFRRTAVRVLWENGFDYGAAVSLERTAFPTRTYNGVTLPAGQYDALRVVLGAGKGQNWWCVMFPPLCLPAAEKQPPAALSVSDEALQLAQSEPRFELRFWLLEKLTANERECEAMKEKQAAKTTKHPLG